MIALSLQLDNKTIILIASYGANSNKPDFINKLVETSDLLENEDIIICGFVLINPDINSDNYVQINNPGTMDIKCWKILMKCFINSFR